MTKTIAINAGSSGLKWQLYQMPEEKVLAKGLIERIGLKDSISTVKFDGRSEQQILISKIIHKLLKFYWMTWFVSILSRLMTRLQVLDTVLLQVENISKESTVVEGDVLEKKLKSWACWLLSTIQPMQQVFVPSRNCCQTLPVVVLILHFHTTYARKLIAILYQQNITQKTRFVNMVPTGKVTSLLQEKRKTLGPSIRGLEIDYLPYR